MTGRGVSAPKAPIACNATFSSATVDEREDILVALESRLAERPDRGLLQFIPSKTGSGGDTDELFTGKGTTPKFGQDEDGFQAQLGPVVIIPDEAGDLFLPEFQSRERRRSLPPRGRRVHPFPGGSGLLVLE